MKRPSFERNPVQAHGTRHHTPPLKQNCPRKKVATIQPSKAGCQNHKKGVSLSPKKQPSPCSTNKTKKTNLHRSRVPTCTHNLMTAFDISVELRHVSQKNWTESGACFDHKHTSHRHDAFGMKICIQRRQLDIWIDLEMISSFGGQELLAQKSAENLDALFLSKKSRKERRGKVW